MQAHHFTNPFIQNILYAGLSFLLSICNLKGQDPFKSFIFSNTNPLTKHYNSITEYYLNHDLHEPLINGIDFRSETNEFRINQQEYSLRIYISSLKYNKIQNQINFIEKELNEFSLKSSQSLMLYQNYKYIVNIINGFELLNIKKQNINLLESALKINAIKLESTTKNDFDSYLSDQLEYEKNKREYKEMEHHLNDLIDKTIIPQVDSSYTKLLIDVPFILHYIENFNSRLVRPETEYYALKSNEAKQKLLQQKAIDNRFFDYAQLKYQTDPQDILSKKLSVGFGVRIPYIIINKSVEENYKIKQLQAGLDLENLLNKKNQKIAEISADLKQQCYSYKLLEESIVDFNKTFDLNKLVDYGLTETKTLMRINAQRNKFNLQLKEAEGAIRETFIDFLYFTDHFYNSPETYYLSKTY